jgi:hypothetical protein
MSAYNAIIIYVKVNLTRIWSFEMASYDTINISYFPYLIELHKL